MGKVKFKRTPLLDDNIDKLINACKEHKEKLIIYVLLDTGLRVSEFVNLKPENIYWQRRYIRIEGKGKKERIVPLKERAYRILEAHFGTDNKINMTSTTAENIVRRVAERAGITQKVSPHVLRHTFAVLALRAGINIRDVQRVLGHSSLTVTEGYLQYSPEQTLEGFKKAGWL